MKRILLIVFLIVISYSIQAQPYLGIIEMYIIPAQPTETDEIGVVIHSLLNYSPCELDEESVYIEQSGNNFVIQTAYFMGQFAAGCLSVDTIPLGLLSAGHYDITVHFNHEILNDSDSLSFFVGTPTNIHSNQQSEMKLNLFPNPLASGRLNVSYTLESISEVNLEIRDLNGKLMVQESQGYQPPGDYTIEMDIAGVLKGVYLFKLTNETEVLSRRIVVQ